MDNTDESLDLQLQPHLAPPGSSTNPVLSPVNDNDVKVRVDDDDTARKTAASHPDWEQFDEDGDAGVRSTSQNINGTRSAIRKQNHTTPKPEPQPNGKSAGSMNGSSSTTPTGQQRPPAVVYNSQSGQAVVMSSAVPSATSPESVIATQHITERWREMERPLRARQMKILKVLSVVAAILFFPCGIPAMYFAWRTKIEFDKGIMQGNIDRAQKFARRTERLIILSAIMAVMVAVLAFALVERASMDKGQGHNYLAHGTLQGR